jgi:hypothetical protein
MCGGCCEQESHDEDFEEDSNFFTDEEMGRLYEIYPSLKEFDEKTGERGLFRDALDGLVAALPYSLKKPIVVGRYLIDMLDNVGGKPDDDARVIVFGILSARATCRVGE